MSNSLWPPGLYSSWSSPGQDAGVGSCSLLQRIFPNHKSNPGLPHCRQILYQQSHQASPRILDLVAHPFSRGSSRPRNQTRVSCIASGFFTSWATREAIPCTMWDLSFLMRDWTFAPCIGSREAQALDHQGSPLESKTVSLLNCSHFKANFSSCEYFQTLSYLCLPKMLCHSLCPFQPVPAFQDLPTNPSSVSKNILNTYGNKWKELKWEQGLFIQSLLEQEISATIICIWQWLNTSRRVVKLYN